MAHLECVFRNNGKVLSLLVPGKKTQEKFPYFLMNKYRLWHPAKNEMIKEGQGLLPSVYTSSIPITPI